MKDDVLDIFRKREGQRLEIADDLVDVFDDTRDRLVLVQHTVDADSPHGRAAQRRHQQPAHCVSERVPETALERLKTEFCDIGIVFALRRLDKLRTDKSPEINCGCHFFSFP